MSIAMTRPPKAKPAQAAADELRRQRNRERVAQHAARRKAEGATRHTVWVTPEMRAALHEMGGSDPQWLLYRITDPDFRARMLQAQS